MKLVNLTPHILNVATATEEEMYIEDHGNIGDVMPTFDRYKFLNLEPSGTVARVEQNREYVGRVGGIPVYNVVTGDVTGLPDTQPDTIYIVSSMVQVAVSGRDDVYSPGELIRDANGKPVGCMGLDAPQTDTNWKQKYINLLEEMNMCCGGGYVSSEYIRSLKT